MEPENPKPIAANVERMRISAMQLKKISAAFRVELSKATTQIYLDEFVKFQPAALEAAADLTIREWSQGSVMPTLFFILDRVEAYYEELRQKHTENHTKEILDRPPTHPDWHSDPGKRKREIQRMILQSWAAGYWGTERQEQGKRELAILEAGGATHAPYSLMTAVRLAAAQMKPETGHKLGD